MTRITKAQLDRIITASDKQVPDTTSHTYSADAFDAAIDNTGDTDLLGYLLLDHYFGDES
ncbi:hypothetical protein [Weissella cibaria]|uniref:Uncharacterized protein n=1 Tax=Weissella cibaria TaxID=137591 RepID=A0A0D1K1Y2_9LACO|nr:hypothetical protein [Weissella cibaria]KIU18984.1 hypothetical protein ab3b_02447 [Weissella cibaria]